ncbi:tensin-2-like isoform X2 [Pseudoliparis swirei]|nr:tensin-2-like isoform X2 [Pseudoliparis swirei]
MENVMERHYDFDLTYITERIISVFFLPELQEQHYRRNLQEVASMLRSKHQDQFLLLNLSEKRHDITRLNPKVQDYGWPDGHAPPLDRICAVCKAMETWLTSDPHHVVVLHCKGHRGKTGVIVAAYMHYSKISAGADQALTTLAMRKFCEDKTSSSLQPSQNRYIYYFGGLLSSSIQMNSSPLFLHQVLIPSLPNFQAGGGFYPFLKIYQSLQLVYTSAVYDPQGSRARKLCVTMQPALLLKGDILVKCFHRRSRSSEREVVFRVQFHTVTVHGAQLWFGKTELDLACTDDRFPPDATVEFIFSNGPDKMKGPEYRQNDGSVTVDDDVSDPVVRWDSYEEFNLQHQDSGEIVCHTRGPLDGSLYAQVRKRRGPGATAAIGGVARSPTVVKPPAPGRPAPLARHAPDSGRRSPAARPEDPEREDAAREKKSGEEEDRETAILDDGDPPSPGGPRRERPCRGGELGVPDARCLARRKNPKSQTLPAQPVAPPPRVELCHRHSVHPLQELPWDRPPPPPPPPCLLRPCCPYPAPDHAHSRNLPALTRLCSGEECHLLRYPAAPSHLSHQSLPSGPYREVFFTPPPPHAAAGRCPCRDCTVRREHQFRPDQSESPSRWTRGAPPWESENPWEAAREAEFWQRKSNAAAAPAFRAGRFPEPRYAVGPHQVGPAPRSLVDGRRTPPPPRHSCPCSPYRASPAESHESRGYASGSASPRSPSPVREQHRGEQVHVGDDVSEGSEGQPESNRKSSPPPGGLDSDQDYTAIDGPAHTEDRAEAPPHDHQEVGGAATPGETQSSSQPIGELGAAEGPTSCHAAAVAVQVQLNGASLSPSPSPSLSSSPSTTSPNSPAGSPELWCSQSPTLEPDAASSEPPSPVPDGYQTPTFPLASYYYPLLSVPRVPYSGYTAVTIPAPAAAVQPPLPEKKRLSSNGHGAPLRAAASSSSSSSPVHHVTFSPSAGEQRRGSSHHGGREEADVRVNAKFVQDSSKFWYKPGISRDQAIAVLRDKEPGSFLIRDSNSFQGAYGLALKVATPPPNANATGGKGDPLEQLVRHFLIETGPRGVRIKGCQNESYFGSLSALVYQHSITPISLPCALRVPEKDLVGELQDLQSSTHTSTAADLLKQGAACNVLYLNSLETESLTGPEAIAKATKSTLALSPRPPATVVHFKVSSQGITLTDSKRRLFFRRHYPINSVTFSSLNPQDQRWTNSDRTSSKMFGFVARRAGSATENVCHLFAEMDPEQPAAAIVNFINKVMLGPQLRR